MKPKSADEMTASYEAALERTAPLAASPLVGDSGTGEALGRAQAFFSGMTEAQVRAGAPAAYADDAYLNDNLAVVEGRDAITEYLARTTSRTRSIDVQFLNSSHEGIEHFVRWRMVVVSDRLNSGDPMVSYGMTHFRFDADGKILLQKDFWDAGTGFYEYVPVLGSVLRKIRSMAEGA